MKTILAFLRSKKAFAFYVGVLTVLLTNIVLPLLGVPLDQVSQIATNIAVQCATLICGQGVADAISGGKTSANAQGSSIIDSKKVKATVLSIVATFLTAVLGLPQFIAQQVINLIAGLLGAYNVLQGISDGIQGKTLPVVDDSNVPPLPPSVPNPAIDPKGQ